LEFKLEHIDAIIEHTGGDADSLIPILLSIQKKYNFLPEPALRRINKLTSISNADIMGIATFYSQFRLQPAGRHFINICTGTACHVKGADRILQTLNSHLSLQPGEDTDSKREFTLRKVACLGCCTLAPVVQIDEMTYGHVTADLVPGMLDDYLASENKKADIKDFNSGSVKTLEGEIRVGLGSCCVAGGSHQVKTRIEQTLHDRRLTIPVKQVGCVGMCHRTPLIEIQKPEEDAVFYGNVSPDAVPDIIRRHFKEPSLLQRLNSSAMKYFEDLIMPGESEAAFQRYNVNTRDGAVADFLDKQIHIATEHSGVLNPLDIEEYISLGGFTALKSKLENTDTNSIIDTVKANLRLYRQQEGIDSVVCVEEAAAGSLQVKS